MGPVIINYKRLRWEITGTGRTAEILAQFIIIGDLKVLKTILWYVVRVDITTFAQLKILVARPYHGQDIIIALFKKLDKTQIDTKLAHETCAGHISRTTCLIALVSFVSDSPTCTAGPGVLSFYNFLFKPFPTSPASICLNLPQLEARLGYI